MKKIKKEIPVFFAADKNYLPFLSVALASLKANASRKYFYRVHILYDGEPTHEDREKLCSMQTKRCSVEFFNTSERLQSIAGVTHCRDYYTGAIYYRLFIPSAFPAYDKAIYLDCDTVLLSDIAELFHEDIGEKLVGAVTDQAVAGVPAFCDYTKNALGIAPEKYFNSGVLIMNLKKLREIDFETRFIEILKSYAFTVAPDQDILNLVCKDKTCYLSKAWNTMPCAGRGTEIPKLVHYNLCIKPWYYSGVAYGEYFWQYANQSPYFDVIAAKRASLTDEQSKHNEQSMQELLALAQAEADSPYNYLRVTTQKTGRNTINEGGMYGFIEDITRKASLT